MLENEGVALRAIRWSEIFPWLSIGKSFRLALSLRLVVYGAAAWLLTLLTWWIIAWCFSSDTGLNDSWRAAFGDETVWQVIDRSVPDRPSLAPSSSDLSYSETPPIRAWHAFSQPVLQFFNVRPSQSMPAGDVFALVLSAFCSLAIWAFFGAAICRVAAVELATGERVGWGASLRWACAKWLPYFSAPLVPMVGVGLAVVPVFVLGLLMKSGSLAALAGLIWPLVLLAAFVMALLLLGVLAGWPLMWATISVEGTDSFDALSRTYAYVFQKPVRYLIYIIIAAVVGGLGWYVVANFAAAVIWLGAGRPVGAPEQRRCANSSPAMAIRTPAPR